MQAEVTATLRPCVSWLGPELYILSTVCTKRPGWLEAKQ